MSTMSVLDERSSGRWKHVLLLTAFLICLYFVSFTDLSRAFDTSVTTSPTSQSSRIQAASPPGGKKDVPVVAVNHIASSPAAVDPAKFMPPKDPNDYSVFRPHDAIPADEYVAVCMSVKDQSLDLIEFFVHHYHHMGIRRFYVMDDGSDPPLSSFEYPGIPRSALTFTWMDPQHRVGYMQLRFYIWCIERYSKSHEWIAFLDGDEFLETPGPESLTEILESFEGNDTVGALGVNWRMHTSGGLLKRPESARKGFTTCIYDDEAHNGEGSDNSHIKTIIKTSKAGPPVNPHRFATSPGSITVGEDGDEITSAAWRKPITRRRIGLHHYAVKSREEFEEKLHRGNGMTDPKKEDFWTAIEFKRPHVPCPEMAKYEP